MTDRRLVRPVASALRAVACAVALAAAGACESSSTSAAGPSAPLPSVPDMLADKVIGQADAPVTLIEYGSITCSHCAAFHLDTLPQIRAAYIDTGLVRLVYRDFPVEHIGFSAAMVARCSGDRFFSVLDLFYRSQAMLVQTTNLPDTLAQIVAPAGMTTGDVKACLASTGLWNGLIAMRTAGQAEFDVRVLPTFLAGGRRLEGAQPFGEFEALFRSLL